MRNSHSLLKMLHNHCKNTYEHSLRVGMISYNFGRFLGVQNPEHLIFLGTFHDIGKIMVPPVLLEKKERLSSLEFEFIKCHAKLGEEILKNTSYFIDDYKDVVLFHHENVDGTGYFGRKGDKIPLLSKIIRIVDSYDVMKNGRVYKQSLDQKEIIHELNSLSNKHYDNNLIQKFMIFFQYNSFKYM